MKHGMDNRWRIGVICSICLLGMSWFPGCSLNRSSESGYASWRPFSRTPEIASTVQAMPAKPSIPTTASSYAADSGIASSSLPAYYPPPDVPAPPQSWNSSGPDITDSGIQLPQSASQTVGGGSAIAESLTPPSVPNYPLKPSTSRAQAVVHANNATFEREVLASEEPVLVDFYASWCGPCKRLAPTLNEVVAENPRARVVKVDIDESPELAARYGVRSVPSLIVFKDGQAVARDKGMVSKSRLLSMLDL